MSCKKGLSPMPIRAADGSWLRTGIGRSAWQAGLLACDDRISLPGQLRPVTLKHPNRAMFKTRPQQRSLSAARPRRILTAFPDACAE